MVMPKPKQKKRATLAELEEASRQEINQVDGKRQDIQKAIEKKYLSAQFFVSIVFASEDEMREAMAKQGIKLHDGEYILAKDYEITIRRRKP